MKITRITLCPIEGRFHKFVAMNAGGAGHTGHKPAGITYTNILLRIVTDEGPEGIGVGAGRNDPEYQRALRSFIGANPLELYQIKDGIVGDRLRPYAATLSKYPHLDAAFLDLIGKIKGTPCWKLLGAKNLEKVPALRRHPLFLRHLVSRPRHAGSCGRGRGGF